MEACSNPRYGSPTVREVDCGIDDDSSVAQEGRCGRRLRVGDFRGSRDTEPRQRGNVENRSGAFECQLQCTAHDDFRG